MSDRPLLPDSWRADQDQVTADIEGPTLWQSEPGGVVYRLRALEEIPGEVEYFLEERYPIGLAMWHYAGKLSGPIARALIENAELRGCVQELSDNALLACRDVVADLEAAKRRIAALEIKLLELAAWACDEGGWRLFYYQTAGPVPADVFDLSDPFNPKALSQPQVSAGE